LEVYRYCKIVNFLFLTLWGYFEWNFSKIHSFLTILFLNIFLVKFYIEKCGRLCIFIIEMWRKMTLKKRTQKSMFFCCIRLKSLSNKIFQKFSRRIVRHSLYFILVYDLAEFSRKNFFDITLFCTKKGPIKLKNIITPQGYCQFRRPTTHFQAHKLGDIFDIICVYKLCFPTKLQANFHKIQDFCYCFYENWPISFDGYGQPRRPTTHFQARNSGFIFNIICAP
jgi:hypothetical protein